MKQNRIAGITGDSLIEFLYGFFEVALPAIYEGL
jgi:hypothetical protein